MAQWEYRVQSLVIAGGGFEVWGEFLAGIGQDGWELVNDHVDIHADRLSFTVFGTFKRPANP